MLKVNCKVNSDVIISFNHKYKISSFLYSLIKKENKELFDLYHNNKNMIKGKPLKAFVFSNLKIPESQIFKNTGYLLNKDFFFYLNSSDKRIQKIFKDNLRKIVINNTVFETEVSEISLKEDCDTFISMSPVVVGIREGNLQKYLSPRDEGYLEKIKSNINRKYYNLFGRDIEEPFDIEIIDYDKKGNLEHYKNNPIKSYSMIFKLKIQNQKLKNEIKQVIIQNGLGSSNSMGFGLCMPYDKGGDINDT